MSTINSNSLIQIGGLIRANVVWELRLVQFIVVMELQHCCLCLHCHRSHIALLLPRAGRQCGRRLSEHCGLLSEWGRDEGLCTGLCLCCRHLSGSVWQPVDTRSRGRGKDFWRQYSMLRMNKLLISNWCFCSKLSDRLEDLVILIPSRIVIFAFVSKFVNCCLLVKLPIKHSSCQ